MPIGAVTVTATAGTGTSFPATAKDALVNDRDVRELKLTLVDKLGGLLKGRVLLSDGTTPAGKGVRVSTVSNIGAELAVTTRSDGTYEFAKILAPGLRIGYVAAAPAVLRSVGAIRSPRPRWSRQRRAPRSSARR